MYLGFFYLSKKSSFVTCFLFNSITMKKILLLLAVALFTIVSCTNDDSWEDNQSGGGAGGTALVNRAIETYNDGTVIISEFSYQEGTAKIANITYSDTVYDAVTYNGDLIQKIEKFRNDTLIGQKDFEYNTENQLIQYTYKDLDSVYAERIVYTHNGDSPVSFEKFSGTPDDQSTPMATGSITFTNNNITQYTYTLAGETTPVVTTYTFDDKNSAYKNITGYSVFYLIEGKGGDNNILTRTVDTEVYTSVVTYLAIDYPETSSETSAATDTLEPQFQYGAEYYYIQVNLQ